MKQPKNLWNQRFGATEYAYGIQPNTFFAQKIKDLPIGRLLMPAEGEGRNAVFAAQNGWEVTAFDISEAGKKKAEQLAQKHQVSLDYRVGTLEEMDFEPNSFDAIGLVYAHFPPPVRLAYHQQLLSLLRPGGTLILEGFAKEQLDYQPIHQSGGPPIAAMLFSKKELQEEFAGLDIQELKNEEVTLEEGIFHVGLARVIRLLGRKTM